MGEAVFLTTYWCPAVNGSSTATGRVSALTGAQQLMPHRVPSSSSRISGADMVGQMYITRCSQVLMYIYNYIFVCVYMPVLRRCLEDEFTTENCVEVAWFESTLKITYIYTYMYMIEGFDGVIDQL